MARNLNFDGTTRQIPAQNLNVGDRLVKITPNIEVDQIKTLGLPHYAYKELPIARIASERNSGQVAQEKPIVIAKGTIVSLLTDQTVIEDSTYAETTSSIANPAASGVIPGYESVATGSIVNYNQDNSYFGYDDSVISLLVPANGGDNAEYAYSALDDEFGAWNTSASANITLNGNLPAGIVYNDVYLDIRGAALNYELQNAVGVACSGLMNLPFVDVDKVANFGNAAGVDLANPAAGNVGYDAVYKSNAFVSVDSGTATASAVSGSLLKSDMYGRFVVQANGSLVTGTPTIQTIARLVTTDSRFPKTNMDEIRTYPGMRVPNVQTAGIPTDLYVFVKAVLTATAGSATATDVRDAIRSGAFGYARINLNV